MMGRSKCLWGLLLLLPVSVACAQDGNPQTLQAQVDELRQTVKALQAEVKALKANQAPAPAAAATTTPASPPAQAPAPLAGARTPVQAAPVAAAQQEHAGAETAATALGVKNSPLPARQSVADNPIGVSRIDNEAAPTDTDLKGFFPIPGTETMIRLGGYAKLDAMYDTSPAGNTDQFVTAAIPVPRPSDASGNFNLQARQTRFSFEVRRPTIFGQSMRFYLENDFYGGSNGDYQFHLRQAFGQLGNTYAGYGYSAFMDADALPDTLDFAGPGGQMFLLQPSVHQAFRLGAHDSLTVSMERPESEVGSIDAGSALHGTQAAPDVVIAGRTEHAWGHVQLGAVVRRLGYGDGTRSGHAMGGGVALSSVLTAGSHADNSDLLMFSAAWGKGIARYLSDTSGSGLDAAVDGDGRLHALKGWGSYAAFTHYWNNAWRSNLVYGLAHVQATPWLVDTAFRRSTYAAANLIWSPAPELTVGMELLYGELELQSGLRNNTSRIQGSLQYNFVK